MLCFSFLQSKSSCVAVPWLKRNLVPCLTISILIFHVSQTRYRFRNKGPPHGARTAAPVRALKGAYIGANLWAVGGLYDVVDFGPVSNTLEWWMRTAAAPGASLITAFVAHSRAASNQLHIIKGFVTARLGARRQAGLRSAGRCRTGNRLWVLCGGGRCGASCGRKESKPECLETLPPLIVSLLQKNGLLGQSEKWKTSRKTF